MKAIIMYETDDGQVFRDENEAKFHEDLVEASKKFKVTVTLTQYMYRDTRFRSIDALIDEIKEDMDDEYNSGCIESCDVNVEVLDDD